SARPRSYVRFSRSHGRIAWTGFSKLLSSVFTPCWIAGMLRRCSMRRPWQPAEAVASMGLSTPTFSLAALIQSGRQPRPRTVLWAERRQTNPSRLTWLPRLEVLASTPTSCRVAHTAAKFLRLLVVVDLNGGQKLEAVRASGSFGTVS